MSNQTQNGISDERLEVIHRRVNLYIGDNNATPLLHAFDLKLRRLDADGKAWGIDAEEELTALRASHKRLVEALSWALDLLDMYDKNLVEMGEPKEMVYAAVHLTAKAKARADLAEARKLEGK